ncbi:hypothetical protein CKJ89_26950 [Klebsiella pneumoniae]|nr:hypothetical protein CKJ89_26950 [Klebsiella pneumoniae]
MLIRVDYSGLIDLPILTRYQYIAIVGEKVSCVFLINHYLSLNKYCINLQYLYYQLTASANP